MHFTISERLRPFSHLPGTSTMIPGLGYQIEIFPCLFCLYDLNEAYPRRLIEVGIELKGPFQQFTVCNDLEKGRLTISGKAREGWFRYHLICGRQKSQVRLLVDRAPNGGVAFVHGNARDVLKAHEWIELLDKKSKFEAYLPPACDRLSFGNHKSQEWEMIKRRLSLLEIFPLWHRLGQLIPSFPYPLKEEGTLALLGTCARQEKPELGEESWLNLMQAGFSSMLVPRFEDHDHQGLVEVPFQLNTQVSPLVLLTEGSRLMRRLFVQQERGQISFLPFLLPCFHHGRLLDVQLEGGVRMSMEWTKKVIRQVTLFVEQDQELLLHFRSNVRSYRLRQHSQDKGEKRLCGSSANFKANCLYLIDNFN